MNCEKVFDLCVKQLKNNIKYSTVEECYKFNLGESNNIFCINLKEPKTAHIESTQGYICFKYDAIEFDIQNNEICFIYEDEAVYSACLSILNNIKFV